jgi:hypothetical protein
VTNEDRVDAFRQVLAEAVMLGMAIGGKPYSGLMLDPENEPVRAAIDTLYASTDRFLAGGSLEGLSTANSIPLYQEMHILRTLGGVACEH